MGFTSEAFAGDAVEDQKGEEAEADRQHDDVEHRAVLRAYASRRNQARRGAVFTPGKLSATAYIFEGGRGRLS